MPTPTTTSPRHRSVVVPVLVAVIALALTVAAVVATRPDPSAAGTTPSDRQSAAPGADDPLGQLARRTPGDPLALGDPDAPVVMVSFSEFQCPFCGSFARDTEPGLIDKYVEDGTLRIEWRDFPYLGEESTTAALAGRAAALQGRFWQFHDALYAQKRPVNSGVLTEEYLASVARGAGLDAERLVEDMARPDLAEAVRKDFAEGQAIGVTGTPAFLINGQPVIGAQDAAVFEQVIEAAAAAAR